LWWRCPGYKVFALELELETGRILKETSLGRYAYGGVIESPEEFYFSPRLLPQALFVDLEHSGQHRFVRIAGGQ
jgi:hypothetical protein